MYFNTKSYLKNNRYHTTNLKWRGPEHTAILPHRKSSFTELKIEFPHMSLSKYLVECPLWRHWKRILATVRLYLDSPIIGRGSLSVRDHGHISLKHLDYGWVRCLCASFLFTSRKREHRGARKSFTSTDRSKLFGTHTSLWLMSLLATWWWSAGSVCLYHGMGAVVLTEMSFL